MDIMGYDAGRKALQREIELLLLLRETANKFKAIVAEEPIASFIVDDWFGSFDKLRKLNAELIADNDENFVQTLKGEQELLNSFLNVAGKTGFANSWKELFQKDIEIAKQLLLKK
jgi:hypothetical protein